MDITPHALLDLRYPDFTARHVFTAKLRLVILVGFWLLCLVFFPNLLTFNFPLVLVISGTFVVTTICYAFILRGIWPVFFFIIELAADIAAHTVLIYITGGPSSNLVSIYIVYCAAGGLFYNYRVSLVISLLALIFYSSLLLLLQWEILLPFPYELGGSEIFQGLGPFQNLVLLLAFLGVAIYGIWIASHFTKLRETILEAKNRELIALNRVSSLTRSAISLERVIKEVIRGVHQGMGYDAAFLMYFDHEQGKIRAFLQEDPPYVRTIRKEWKVDPDSLYLPLENETNVIYQAMKRKKLIIRYELFEIVRGAVPTITKAQADALQEHFGFKKFIAAPLVAEDKVIGALVGVSKDPWIETEAVRAFEGFADQAVLAIDNAKLIVELKQKNIELERVSRVKSEFLATMSHELRTPLTAIIGFSELLLEEVMGKISSDQRESLREILANGENLLHLINGILDLAKIESGQMELSLGPISLEDLLERVQRMIASLIQKKGHRLELNIHKPCPVVYADERKIQQVLLNLLSNAIKFTPDGGLIRVEVTYQAEGHKEGNGTLQVSVSDSGVGIAEVDLKNVFESFQQADSSYTREYQGTGLGLALVRQFVELHGGTVKVRSELGKGSTFTFSIPSHIPVGDDPSEMPPESA